MNNSEDTYKAKFGIKLSSFNLSELNSIAYYKKTDNFVDLSFELAPLLEGSNTYIKKSLEEIDNSYDAIFNNKAKIIQIKKDNENGNNNNSDNSSKQKCYDYKTRLKFKYKEKNEKYFTQHLIDIIKSTKHL